VALLGACPLPDPSERLGGPPRADLSAENPRGRRELILLLILLACGLFLVPLLIWVVGNAVLGPYASGGAFALLADFFVGLRNGSVVHWAVVVGPYVFVLILRGLWHLIRRPRPSD
jgi:hypothetical protein